MIEKVSCKRGMKIYVAFKRALSIEFPTGCSSRVLSPEWKVHKMRMTLKTKDDGVRKCFLRLTLSLARHCAYTFTMFFVFWKLWPNARCAIVDFYLLHSFAICRQYFVKYITENQNEWLASYKNFLCLFTMASNILINHLGLEIYVTTIPSLDSTNHNLIHHFSLTFCELFLGSVWSATNI